MKPILKTQEIPHESPESICMFDPREKQLVATPGAISHYNGEIRICIAELMSLAKKYGGLDRLQVFMSPEPQKPDLWIIEDPEVITALLPEEY